MSGKQGIEGSSVNEQKARLAVSRMRLTLGKVTSRVAHVVLLANWEAARLNHEYISTEHILLGMLKEKPSVAAAILHGVQVDPETVLKTIEDAQLAGPEMVTMPGMLPRTPRARQVFQFAGEAAERMGFRYAGVEHLLMGLLHVGDECAAGMALIQAGCTLERIVDLYSNPEAARTLSRIQQEQIQADERDSVGMMKALQTKLDSTTRIYEEVLEQLKKLRAENKRLRGPAAALAKLQEVTGKSEVRIQRVSERQRATPTECLVEHLSYYGRGDDLAAAIEDLVVKLPHLASPSP